MKISSIGDKLDRPTALQLVRTSQQKENSASGKASTQECALINMLLCIMYVYVSLTCIGRTHGRVGAGVGLSERERGDELAGRELRQVLALLRLVARQQQRSCADALSTGEQSSAPGMQLLLKYS